MKVAPFGYEKDTIREELARIRHPFRIAIERAKNPFNIGSIIRVAHSFLVKEIILIGTEPYYERAAMGMQRFENVTHIDTNAGFLERAKKEAWKLVVFEREYAQCGLWDAQMPDDAVLVFGNENDGVSAELRAAAHEIVSIPMFGINHSYPVTAAASMAMAEWARRYYQGGRVVEGSESRSTAEFGA